MPDEVSPGGSEIYRHRLPEGTGPPDLSAGDPELIAAIEAHLDACFGDTERDIFHELVSPTVHLDVHVVPATDEFPVTRLVTSGMAERPMTIPPGSDLSPFAELTIALPPDWRVREDDLDDERVYWPLRLLKELARLPHDYSTFLGEGHTIPNGDPPDPYAPDTELCCALIVPPLSAPEGFGEIKCGDRTVNVLGVLPIYKDETSFKLKRGTSALLDRFDEAGLTDVVDPARPSAVKRRRRFLRGRD